MFLNKVEGPHPGDGAQRDGRASSPRNALVAVLGVRDPVRAPAGGRLLLRPALHHRRASPSAASRAELDHDHLARIQVVEPGRYASKPPAGVDRRGGAPRVPPRSTAADGLPHKGPVGSVSVTSSTGWSDRLVTTAIVSAPSCRAGRHRPPADVGLDRDEIARAQRGVRRRKRDQRPVRGPAASRGRRRCTAIVGRLGAVVRTAPTAAPW